MNMPVDRESVSNTGRLWALVPVIILGGMLAGWSVMLSYALDDPSFGVEPDCYQKAVEFDAHQAQALQNEQLGFHLGVDPKRVSEHATVLRARLADRHGTPLGGARIELTGFHLARSTELIEATLSEQKPGVYSARLPMTRAGLWELRFRVEHDGALFTQVARTELER